MAHTARSICGGLAGLLGWLEEKPDLDAKEMLKRLQASGYDAEATVSK